MFLLYYWYFVWYSKLKIALLDKDKILRSNQKEQLHLKDLQKNQFFKPETVVILLINKILEYTKSFDKGDKSVYVEAIDNNIYEWKVLLSDFPKDSDIYLDLMQLCKNIGIEYNNIELRISFLMGLFPILKCFFFFFFYDCVIFI